MQEQEQNGTEILLAKAAEVEEAKQLKIQELLAERIVLVGDTEERLEGIKAELKALGYKAPRKKSEKILDKPAVAE